MYHWICAFITAFSHNTPELRGGRPAKRGPVEDIYKRRTKIRKTEEGQATPKRGDPTRYKTSSSHAPSAGSRRSERIRTRHDMPIAISQPLPSLQTDDELSEDGLDTSDDDDRPLSPDAKFKNACLVVARIWAGAELAERRSAIAAWASHVSPP
ncbi:hypothetical protein DACRYDRAFT_108572 [Dacryopinax primogenitus]|uniref:Uncharacterized protein n=1 Tax=Dacryopinax primogenitus (strain DJM 731) TaxID=1858805 RepID=M5FXI3_DACPD|nr:uncharacterized protein DACRYDRAFT_108572 [Dacryopinax primogenitus]EJU00505.1 hypothetical protein DACRYDRAFT_108572 [Dacryopinax primogenitus]